jgi:hypothetical protein
MQRAMAKQAEAEREKRAKIVHAAGELEASVKLRQAATAMAAEPMTITLRLPPDTHGNRQREELDHRLPLPHRGS